MAKGKYAVRTANREAARDNELIADQADRIKALEAELNQAQIALNRERAERNGLVVAQADRLSARQIAVLREEHQAVLDARNSRLRAAADYLCGYFHHHDDYPNDFIRIVLPALIPNTAERNARVDAIFAEHPTLREEERGTNRYTRRHSAENIARNSRRLVSRDSGAELLVRKSKLDAEVLEKSDRRGLR